MKLNLPLAEIIGKGVVKFKMSNYKHFRLKEIIIITFLLGSLLILSYGCYGTKAKPRCWPGATVVENTLYVSSMDGKIFALDPSTGNRDWEYPAQDESLGVIYGTPVATESSVYVGTYDGTIYAVNAEKGTKKWEFSTEGHIVSSPAIADNLVLAGSSDKKLHAVDAETGTEKWFFETGDEIWATPTVKDDVVYFGSFDHKFYAVSLADGKLVWDEPFKTDGAITSTAIVDEDTVYISSFDSKLYALDTETGELKWKFEARNWFWTKPLLADDVIYIGCLDHNVYAIDAKVGEEKWHKSIDSSVMSSPILSASGSLIVASSSGKVYWLNPESGEGSCKFDARKSIRSSPCSHNGMIYLTPTNKIAYALDEETGNVKWSISLE